MQNYNFNPNLNKQASYTLNPAYIGDATSQYDTSGQYTINPAAIRHALSPYNNGGQHTLPFLPNPAPGRLAALGAKLGEYYDVANQWAKDNPLMAGGIGLSALAGLGAGGYYLHNKNKKKTEKSASILAKEASAYFYKKAEAPAPAPVTPPATPNPIANGYNQAVGWTQDQIQAINNWMAQNPWYAAAIAGGVGLGGGAVGGYMAGAPAPKKKKKR